MMISHLLSDVLSTPVLAQTIFGRNGYLFNSWWQTLCIVLLVCLLVFWLVMKKRG